MTNTITANIMAEIYNSVIFAKIWKTVSLKQGSIRSNVSEGGILYTPFTKIIAEFRKQDSDYFCACLFPTIQSQSPGIIYWSFWWWKLRWDVWWWNSAQLNMNSSGIWSGNHTKQNSSSPCLSSPSPSSSCKHTRI